MRRDHSRPCQKDKRCYRWDGHPGPHAYPDTGWGPCTATEHAPGCSHVYITERPR